MLMHLGEGAAAFKFMIHDRGGQFTDTFGAVLADAGIRAIKSPPQAPRRTRSANTRSAPCAGNCSTAP
jgi:hypothetical protein